MKIQEWFMICITVALIFTMFAGFISCANDDYEKRKQWAKQNPVPYAKEQCSRPACWSEGDWIEYCKRVQCKQR